jgi:uncharacterized protein YodC (DUF2158 family)
MMDLKLGDVVRLKSGGPKMTVNDIEEVPGVEGVTVFVLWFGGEFNEELKGEDFRPELLVRIEDAP